MNNEKELFNLAKMYVMLSEEFKKELPEYELEEVKEELEKISSMILNKNYDIEKFVYYQQLYKEMSIGEYFEFIKMFK